jgi:SanA protein
MKLFLRINLYLISLLILFVLGTNFWIIISTQADIHYLTETLPSKKVALVLGTSKRTSNGDQNQFFDGRINAATDLFHKNIIDHILVSGDTRSKYYNEPRDMFDALVARNVPSESITLDYAGLRTLESITRCSKVFGQDEFIIITQEFHCYRSQFIANYHGLNVVSFVAPQPEQWYMTVMMREIVARPLAILDLYVWNREPRLTKENKSIPI